MRIQRKTIATSVAIEGISLHAGVYTRLELRPAISGTGIVFVRTDLNDLRIPALQSSTTALDYATTVGKDDVSIGTVEHLLSAIAAYGITDLEIRIDGCEVPILDGSAVPFVHLLDAAGTRELAGSVGILRIRRPIEVQSGEKRIRIEPAERLSIRYRIDFAHKVIGKETFHFELDREEFVRRIAPARTYGFLRDVEQLRAVGLARGGSIENCVVLDDEKVVNGPLRFRDEFVRHKVLDLIGDLVLLGRPMAGAITAYKAGHALHAQLVAAILDNPDAWSIEDEIPERQSFPASEPAISGAF
ncbi:MAG: UDP-3-O-acyl-N-acetylglucosamine deacetylase [Thermoanaerobaculia bacterium]